MLLDSKPFKKLLISDHNLIVYSKKIKLEGTSGNFNY